MGPANANATATAPQAIRSDYDRKSAAAAAPAPTADARTAAAAATALNPVIDLTPQQRKELREKGIEGLKNGIVVFQKFDPTLQLGSLSTLSIDDIITFLFGNMVCGHETDNCKAIRRILSSFYYGSLRDVPKELKEFLTICKIPNDRHDYLINAFGSPIVPLVSILSKYPQARSLPLMPIPCKVQDLSKLRRVFLKLTQGISSCCLLIWKDLEAEIQNFNKKFSEGAAAAKHDASLSNKIKKGRANNQAQDTCFAIAKKAFRHLGFYIKRQFPAIAHQCLQINPDEDQFDSAATANLDGIMRDTRFSKMCKELLNNLSSYEALICYIRGFHPQSMLARTTLEEYVCDGYKARYEFFSELQNELVQFCHHRKTRFDIQDYNKFKSKIKLCADKILHKEAIPVSEKDNPNDQLILDILFPLLKKHCEKEVRRNATFTKDESHARHLTKTTFSSWVDPFMVLRETRKRTQPIFEELFRSVGNSAESYRCRLNALIKNQWVAKSEIPKGTTPREYVLNLILEEQKKLFAKESQGKGESEVAHWVEMDSIATAISFVMDVDASQTLFSNAFKALLSIERKILDSTMPDRVEVSNRHLNALLLEENTERLQRLAEEAKAEAKAKKQSTATPEAAAAALVEPQAPPVEPPKPASAPSQVVPVCFRVSNVQVLFELRHLIAQWHGFDPATVMPPSSAKSTSLSVLAKQQQVYAFDGFLTALELYALCKEPQDRIAASQLVLQWGYLMLEQGITVKHAEKFPKRFLMHDLRQLLRDLGIQPGDNFWTQHAPSNTLYHRYPDYYARLAGDKMPLALLHAQKTDDTTLQQIDRSMLQLQQGAAAMQVAVLAHQSPEHPLVKQAQKVASALQANAKTESEQKDVEALNPIHSKTLDEWEKKLKAQLELLGKTEASEQAAPSLANARHHLQNLLRGLGLLKRFPQQCYLHILTHSMLSSIKDFAENYGSFLAAQAGRELVTHDLRAFDLDQILGSKHPAQKTLKEINIFKGNEYTFSYFAIHPADKVSPLMVVLSELYQRSQEAIFMGSGAIPSGAVKAKDVATLQGDVVALAVRFAELATALITP